MMSGCIANFVFRRPVNALSASTLVFSSHSISAPQYLWSGSRQSTKILTTSPSVSASLPCQITNISSFKYVTKLRNFPLVGTRCLARKFAGIHRHLSERFATVCAWKLLRIALFRKTSSGVEYHLDCIFLSVSLPYFNEVPKPSHPALSEFLLSKNRADRHSIAKVISLRLTLHDADDM